VESDGGASWKRVLFGGSDSPDAHASINAIAFVPSSPKTVYAATDTGPNDGVWKSGDGGATWARHKEGLPSNFRLNALVIDPATPTTLYVGSNGEDCKSVDGGKTWARPRSPATARVRAVAGDRSLGSDSRFAGSTTRPSDLGTARAGRCRFPRAR
jgi:photosystem II stability/assembly factor-like uncharacterized protein